MAYESPCEHGERYSGFGYVRADAGLSPRLRKAVSVGRVS